MAVSHLKTRARPTNSDIVAAIGELHDCLHGVDQKITAVATDVSTVKERVSKVEGYQQGIATHLRVPGQTEGMSFVRKWKGPIALAGAVFGAIAAFVAVYPFLRGLLLVLDAYLTTAP